MISESIEFRDFDAERFENLARLVRGGRETPTRPPILLVQRDRGRVVKAYHTRVGRIPPDDIDAKSSAEELAKAHEARFAVVLEQEALRWIHETGSSRFRSGRGLLELGLEIARAADEAKKSGRLDIWPDVFEGIEPPSFKAMQRVFDIILPPRHTLLLYVFEGSRLHSEIICTRGPSDIVLLSGHDALGTGSTPPRWREDYKHILKETERRLGTPALGVFVSLETALAIVRGHPKVDISRALARKDLILDPLPVWLAGPLGVAAVRNVVGAGKRVREKLVERVKPRGFAGKLAGRMASKVASKVKDSLEDRIRRAGALERVEQTVDIIKKRTELGDSLGFDPFVVGRRIAEAFRDPKDR